MDQHSVGLIGTGLVGMALAERFHNAGWKVIGYDIDAARLRDLELLTGTRSPIVTDAAVADAASVGADAGSIRHVVAATDFIVLSLPTSRIASEVVTGVEDQIVGKTIIDTTTGEPAEMQALGERLANCGARYVDATIAGSSAQVRSGEVIVMIGGDTDTVASCDELIRSFASKIFHVGPWGAGARMKLVVNLVLGLNRAVLAEGLCFAERSGVDPRLALEVLRAGPAFSRVMDTKGGKMLDGEFTPQARLAQHLKDVRLILSQGQTCNATLPLSALHEQLLEGLVKAGHGDLDNCAIIKAFRTPPLGLSQRSAD